MTFIQFTENFRLVKAICPDSKIAQSMTCAATKCTQIVKVLGTEYTSTIIDAMRQQNFSLLIDESNSRKSPVLALLVRYLDKVQNSSVTKFVCLLSLSAGTAEAIFTEIDQFFR